MKTSVKILSLLSALAAAAVLSLFLSHEVQSVSSLGAQITEARATETMAGAEVYFTYDGVIYKVGHQCWSDGDEAEAREYICSFIDEKTAVIFFALWGSAALFALAATLLGSYCLVKMGPKRRFLLPEVALAAFAGMMAVLALAWFGSGLTLTASLQQILGAAAAVLGLAAATAFAQLFYRKCPRTLLIWVLVLVLAVAGYFTGLVAKGRIWVPAYNPSFDYVADLDSRFGQEELIDLIVSNPDGTVTFEGTTYAPEMIPNPDRATGATMVALCAAELLNPGTGIYVNIMLPDSLDEYTLIAALYCLHAALLAAVGLLLLCKPEAASERL